MATTVRVPTSEPTAPDVHTFRVVLKPSHWLPVTGITVVGCADADAARRKLHEELDAHILQIEPGR